MAGKIGSSVATSTMPPEGVLKTLSVVSKTDIVTTNTTNSTTGIYNGIRYNSRNVA